MPLCVRHVIAFFSVLSKCPCICSIGQGERESTTSFVSKTTFNFKCFPFTSVCDKNHTAWSNHTMCEKTCANRYNPIPIAECVEIAEGCICDDDYYLNQLGECVKEENCSVCYTPEPKQVRQLFLIRIVK